jgi:protein-S-isoprenylcysteine O-methyltransferase Ste14
MARFPKLYADTVAKLRVPSGFLLVVAFGWLADPTWTTLTWGIPVSVVGLWLRAWAAGHLAKNRDLATGGPYAFIRNPLYVGTLMVAAGLVISAQRIELAVLFAAVFAFVYLPVIELEEQHLRTLFPAYSEYARQVPMLVPQGRRIRSSASFRASLYRKNEEYNALLGFLAGLGWLLYRAWK